MLLIQNQEVICVCVYLKKIWIFGQEIAPFIPSSKSGKDLKHLSHHATYFCSKIIRETHGKHQENKLYLYVVPYDFPMFSICVPYVLPISFTIGKCRSCGLSLEMLEHPLRSKISWLVVYLPL